SRYRLISYVEGEPYQQAEVELFEDDPTFDDLSAEAERAKQLFIRLLRASRRIKSDQDDEIDHVPELPNDAQSVSFIVSAYLDIENNEKQRLLELTDTGKRLSEVNRIIERLAEEYEKKALIYHISKKNGHGGKPPNLADLN